MNDQHGTTYEWARSWRPYVPGEILYHHAQSLGRIEARLDTIGRRLDRLETKSLLGMGPIHWLQIGIGITVLGAAITGRMSWGESLPIVGKMFGGL